MVKLKNKMKIITTSLGKKKKKEDYKINKKGETEKKGT